MPGTPDARDTVSNIRSLPETECFELLAVAVVGRVGFASPAGLQIIPMSYRLGADRQLFMKTAPGSALARLAAIDAPVAFEVDYHAADFRIAWSVLMNGTISRLDAAHAPRLSVTTRVDRCMLPGVDLVAQPQILTNHAIRARPAGFLDSSQHRTVIPAEHGVVGPRE